MSRTAIVFIIFGVLALVGIIGMIIQRARAVADQRRERRTPIPLVIPVTRGAQPPTPWRPPATPTSTPSGASYAQPMPVAAVQSNGSNGPYSHMETPDPVRRSQVGFQGASQTPAQSAVQTAAMEGTLQLLPGRFEVVTGLEGGRDIRFVRGPGAVPEITLGRMDGPSHRHVQLAAQTVSRMHARMRFEGGRWHIANLSPTNPVMLNGEPLDVNAQSHVLNDGDRVELGEVVLRFRERA